jgi:glycosyltransferase involved in cell wall biosynthesis
MSAKRARQRHRQAARMALRGEWAEAEKALSALLSRGSLEPALAALCHNDLGVLAAMRGEPAAARGGFDRALALQPGLAAARLNLGTLGTSSGPAVDVRRDVAPPQEDEGRRLAIVSMLFNWPSSGGGMHDSVAVAAHLQQCGMAVARFYAVCPAVGIGAVSAPLSVPSTPVHIGEHDSASQVAERFREAVDRYDPEIVLITDCWSFRPHLLEAFQGRACFLRFHAAECLCPLNNVRYLVGSDGPIRCESHLLADPEGCLRCLHENRHCSGPLHQWERQLSGAEEPGFSELVRSQFARARGAAVNNPLLAEIFSPFLPNVQVITSGVDAGRFLIRDPGDPAVKTILMAGVIEEPMKGFSVLRDACARLRAKRQDYRVLVTGQRPGQMDECTWSVGWQPPASLPELYAQADICVVPSVCEEAFGIVALEAMAAGRPVVASRAGGLQFTVVEGETGWLFSPGDAGELAERLDALLDDPGLRHRMGAAGRQRAQEFDWRRVVRDRYLPWLLGPNVPAREGGGDAYVQ